MRVVVTGMGAVSAFGVGVPALGNGIFSGARGVRDLSLFSLTGAKSSLAAEVPGLEVASVFSEAEREGSSRTDAMTVLAAREALAAARLSPSEHAIDVALGGTTAGMFETEELLTKLDGDLDRAAGERLRTHPLSSTVDKLHAAVGPFRSTRTVCCACTSGAAAIALASAWIRTGRSTVVLAGGADALCRLTYSGFGALSVLDRAACRPFDRTRAGLTLGEGAALLVLESEESARARGVRPIAELAGFALGAEAHHITNPEPGGATAARIMSRAVASAGITPREVGYLNAHGTGTPQNDANEASAIRACFGDARVPVSTSKAQIGHTLGASGALEAAISIMAIERETLPPTVGAADPDPACDVDHVGAARPTPGLDVVVSNSFGFGGTGASLVLARTASLPEPAASSKNGVVVTGAAAIVPSGLVTGSALASLLGADGRPGAAVDPLAGLDANASRRMDRSGRLSTAVIGAALVDADGRGDKPVDRSTVAALSGTAFGCVDGSMRFMKRVIERGANMASPADFPNLVPSSPVSHASIYWRLGGPAIATPDLSATAESAIATGVELVESGTSPNAVAGSVEEVSKLSERVLAPLLGIRTMTAAGDGASAILLESEVSANARGARALAKITLVTTYRGDGVAAAAAAIAAVASPRPRDGVASERAVDPARVLAASPWREVARAPLSEAAGDHVGCGGVALAAAVALLGETPATRPFDRILFVGEAPDRGYVFLLEAVG